MQQQKLSIVAFLLASILMVDLVPLAFSTSRREALAGGWQPIKDIKDPHVKEIAEFAVSEYNNRSKAELKLESVVKGEMQVVAGINYKLDLLTTPESKQYEAAVWERIGNSKTLISFKSLHP